MCVWGGEGIQYGTMISWLGCWRRSDVSSSSSSSSSRHEQQSSSSNVIVQIQGPVTGLGAGPLQPLSLRSQGVFDEIKEQREVRKNSAEKTVEVQTKVTYKFWLKNPRYEERA